MTNVKLVLQHVLAQEGVTKQRKLSYLNCFARFLGHSDSKRSLGIGSLELLAWCVITCCNLCIVVCVFCATGSFLVTGRIEDDFFSMVIEHCISACWR